MSPAYMLLSQVVGEALVRAVEPDMSLSDAGVGSGSLVRLVLLIEEHCDAALSAEDVDGLNTLGDIDLLIARLTGGRAQHGKGVAADVDTATD